jgi:LuxR family maltose regulon positive regulatory protein
MERPTHGSVLETKLIPPIGSGNVVRRQRLISKALLGAQSRLVLLEAPAGYGKTSVLTQVHQILRNEKRRVAWVSLDEADNDHARFLSHFAAAIRQSGTRFGSSTAALLGSGAPLPASILRTSLLNEIVALDDGIYVFLDDFHCITDREVRETLKALLTEPLPQLHLIIASRGRGALPALGRMRALAQVTHIEGEEMAFSKAETLDFIGKACKVSLQEDQVARLCKRTEGWAASLQLACIALEGCSDIPRFLDTFSGESRNVEDLLVEEVLQRQQPELQQVLLETSILSRFNVALVNAVTGRSDGRRTIDEIEAKNLFLFSLDDQRTWYRYHHLFAEVLRRRLADQDPARLAEIHCNAADWLARNGCLPEAIDHAFRAGDMCRAGLLLEQAAGELFANGQVETLHSHSVRLPLEVRRHLPRLQLELGWGLELEWRFDEAKAMLANVRACLASEKRHDQETSEESAFFASKLAHREMMFALLTDRISDAEDMCRRWTEQTPSQDPFMLASVGTTMMVAKREQYCCDGVANSAESLRNLFLRGGAIYGTVFHDCATGTVLTMRGDLGAAEQAFDRARRCAIELNGEESRLAGMPTAMLAELCYERGELARAQQLIDQHPGFSAAEYGWTDNTIARFVTSARLAFLDGRTDDAECALEAGYAVAEKHGLRRLRVHVLAEQVRQLVAAGRGKCSAARFNQWAPPDSPRLIGPGATPIVSDELLVLSAARIAIERGDAVSAIQPLKKWLAFTKDRRCVQSMVRIGVVLSHALGRSGDLNAARRVLVEIIQTMPHAGFVRSFIDEGPAVIEILNGLLKDHAETGGEVWQRLSRILVGQEGPADHLGPVPPDAVVGDSLGLSPREVHILQLSAQGMANSDICRAVNLSENTIKWYWNRIFSKLQVHRRFDAIKVARRQKLVA